MKKKKLFITITGINHYLGMEAFEIGQVLNLKKEADNPYDSEAIKVTIGKSLKVGYVANSTYTVNTGTLSAGRLYDKIGDKAKVQVKFIMPNCVIARVLG